MILFKKLLRTFLHYKTQFISMILMIMIGIGVFLGFNMEWKTIERNTNDFFSETGFQDFYVEANGTELTIDDYNNVKNLDGVDSLTLFLKKKVKDLSSKNESYLSLSVIKDYGKPTKLYRVKGEAYDEEKEGFYISDKYLNKHNYKIGDNLKLDNGYEAPILGTVKSGQYLICINEDEGQLMPDYSSYGFVYMTPKLYESKADYYYNTLLIESDKSEDFKRNIQEAIGDSGIAKYKNQDVNYSESRGEMEEGQTIGNILPYIFLVIALLTMITTMHRVTINDKIQIGTLKALGFKNRKITTHYASYGLVISIIGSILGIGLGYLICYLIMNPNGMMGTYMDMPKWKMTVPGFGWLVIVLTIILLTFISYLSVRRILAGTAADSLRPYTPKKTKPLIIERFKFFNKLPFEVRWNLRDIFRNKIRSLMTLIGIIGSTLLLVACFSLYESYDKYISAFGDKQMNYKTSITLDSQYATYDDLKDTTAYLATKNCKYDYSKQTSVFVGNDDDFTTFMMLDNKNKLYNVINADYNKVNVSNNEGVYISKKVKDKGYRVSKTIKITTISNLEFEAKILGVITSFSGDLIVTSYDYSNHLMDKTNTCSINEASKDNYSLYTIYTDMKIKELNDDKKLNEFKDNNIIDYYSSKDDLMDTFDSFTEVFYIMIILFAVMSVLLAIIVLYNLGVMSYFERYRQLATLKVVGFKDKHIGKILIAQNLWLTIVGIIIGLPVGILVCKVILSMLMGDYELNYMFGWMTFVFSIVFTLITSLAISYLLSKKNKKVNMVEALKGVD